MVPFFVVLPLITTLLSFFQFISSTPLDDYVWKYDENYKWVEVGTEFARHGHIFDRGYSVYTLNVTSQRWLTDEDFSPNSETKSIWWHFLVILVPEEIRFKQNATIYITASSNDMKMPNYDDDDVMLSAALAVSTGTITGVLFQIPNQGITFASDPIQKNRGEDAVIAYTWDHFLNDPTKPEWLVRFPMVKASLRAMDAMQEFVRQRLPETGATIDYFTVAGASKRGWTTWLVGVVDPVRVQIIIPIVLDAINFVTVEHHQYRSYGGWTYALQDYVDMNITYRFDDPNMLTLQEMEDPYFYRDRLTLPKLVINAAMDEFQQPDDTRYWWDDMPEPKHFIMAPNTEHSFITGIFEAVPAIAAYVNAHLLNHAVPQFHWTIDDTTGEIVATIDSESKVHDAHVWFATSCGVNSWDNSQNRRDYRIAHLDTVCSCGVISDGMCTNFKSIWDKKKLEVNVVKGKRTYSAKLDAPEDGRWVAFFIDIKFKNPDAIPADKKPVNVDDFNKRYHPEPTSAAGKIMKSFERYFENSGGLPKDFAHFFEFTTEVSVWPNTFPYPECSGAACGDVPMV